MNIGFTYFTIFLLIISCNPNSNSVKKNQGYTEIKGITFDGPAKPPITGEMFSGIENTGTTWIATTPEAYTFRNTLEVKSFYKKKQWYGETIHGSITIATLAKEKGYKVMIKPHIGFRYDVTSWKDKDKIDFKEKDSIINSIIKNTNELVGITDPNEFRQKVRNHNLLKEHYDEIDDYNKSKSQYIRTLTNLTKGSWRGDFDVVNQKDWKKWESAYEEYILDLAKIADSLKVELFCVGTELSISSIKRDNFWRQLIKKVKQVYKGSLTFSANWDSYQEIKFWDELDYIGISAYFPLSDKEVPGKDEILEGWKKYSSSLEGISKKFNKHILFTEYGYKSVNFAAKEPWKEYVEYDYNEMLQYNLYEGLYQTFWDKDWFAGGFIWKWYYEGNGGDKSFSPQEKMAQKIMTQWYSNSEE